MIIAKSMIFRAMAFGSDLSCGKGTQSNRSLHPPLVSRVFSFSKFRITITFLLYRLETNFKKVARVILLSL
jgi:hypothetical protein